MKHDDWKTSPPCPACGSPNCFCDDEQDSPEPVAICFCGEPRHLHPTNDCVWTVQMLNDAQAKATEARRLNPSPPMYGFMRWSPEFARWWVTLREVA